MTIRIDELTRLERQLLHERHLISRDLAGLSAGGTVRSAALVSAGAG